MAKASDAQKRALSKYQKEHKDEFKRIHLKFKRNEENAAIIFRLETVGNVQAYIKGLIEADIEKDNGRT